MNTFKTLALTALLAGATVAPFAAQAEGVSGSTSNTYNSDTTAKTSEGTSASGTISSQTFSKLDTDRSGTLSEAEFSKKASTTASFNDLDANNDGTLTLSELQNR